MKTQPPLTLCLAGRFAALNHNQIRVRLTAQGVRVPTRYDHAADALLAATQTSPALIERALRDGLQILREADLDAIWRGEPFNALLARRCLEPASPAPPNDVLSALRGLLHDEPSPDTWAALCQLLDQADQEVQRLAVDYALPRLLAWPLEDTDLTQVHTRAAQLWLQAPRAWARALLLGHWSPRLALIPALDLRQDPVARYKALAELLLRVQWPGLRALALRSDGIYQGPLLIFNDGQPLPNLTHLLLEGSIKPGPLRALLLGPLGQHLRYLCAPHTYHENPLWALPLLGQLDGLEIHSYEPPAEVFPRVRHLRRFTWTSAGARGWTEPEQDALHAPWPALEQLWLTQHMMGRRGLERLLKNDSLERLDDLRLQHCQTGHRALASLAKANHLRRLRRLGLSNCSIGDNGANELARASSLASLEALDLSYNPLGPAAAAPLAAAPAFPRLRALSLRGTRCGDAILARIARHPAPLALERLDLTAAQVTHEGVRQLLLTENLPRLRALYLAGNPLAAEDRGELQRRFPGAEILA